MPLVYCHHESGQRSLSHWKKTYWKPVIIVYEVINMNIFLLFRRPLLTAGSKWMTDIMMMDALKGLQNLRHHICLEEPGYLIYYIYLFFFDCIIRSQRGQSQSFK